MHGKVCRITAKACALKDAAPLQFVAAQLREMATHERWVTANHWRSGYATKIQARQRGKLTRNNEASRQRASSRHSASARSSKADAGGATRAEASTSVVAPLPAAPAAAPAAAHPALQRAPSLRRTGSKNLPSGLPPAASGAPAPAPSAEPRPRMPAEACARI